MKKMDVAANHVAENQHPFAEGGWGCECSPDNAWKGSKGGMEGSDEGGTGVLHQWVGQKMVARGDGVCRSDGDGEIKDGGFGIFFVDIMKPYFFFACSEKGRTKSEMGVERNFAYIPS